MYIQVCEEYKLHRETYYLSVDMYDRFMDTQTGIQKEQLQLIGVTCLFIASKIEVELSAICFILSVELHGRVDETSEHTNIQICVLQIDMFTIPNKLILIPLSLPLSLSLSFSLAFSLSLFFV